ncbi:hypothetical protein ACIRF8_32290 [Streptomyces sp. NPDC102406]|uniref:hypothetical protein n=1 Tax=Streptomyces sp. NPDC102406 TaxID=3366171 RepID=UPI00380B58A9
MTIDDLFLVASNVFCGSQPNEPDSAAQFAFSRICRCAAGTFAAFSARDAGVLWGSVVRSESRRRGSAWRVVLGCVAGRVFDGGGSGHISSCQPELLLRPQQSRTGKILAPDRLLEEPPSRCHGVQGTLYPHPSRHRTLDAGRHADGLLVVGFQNS